MALGAEGEAMRKMTMYGVRDKDGQPYYYSEEARSIGVPFIVFTRQRAEDAIATQWPDGSVYEVQVEIGDRLMAIGGHL